MPHLIIEYAHTLAKDEQVPPLLDAVHAAAVATGLFEESHIRTRAIPVRFYRTGTGTAPFIHAQLRILVGRTDRQKRELSDTVVAAIRAHGWAAQVITAEVVDMDRATYAKYTA